MTLEDVAIRLATGDTVTVTPYAGETAYGPTYRAAVEVDCRVEYVRKLVRSSTGDEVVSETTIYVLPVLQSGARSMDVFAPESLVTHDGRDAQVISAASHRGRDQAVLVEVTTT